ncbi:hypothetical protein BJ944DRAFT_238313 [Cunninghamella echinulata]|nr:hypothetical protein BJ944DRAFT_238313 [Cunninghamella echinulata]
MIWRPTLTHQDYMKYDIQSMTTKFSVRPSVGKTKKMKQSSSTVPKTTTNKQHQHQHQRQCHHPKHDSDRITAIEIKKPEKEKVKESINEDDSEDDDNSDSEEEEDNDINTTKQFTMANNETNSQGVFLNFSYDLSPQSVSRKRKKNALTTAATTTTIAKSKKAAYRVNGVNILNRKNLDSKTAIERLQRRRENHNHVERRRRDTINNIIYELSQVVPHAIWSGKKPHKGNILKATLDYILTLQEENRIYKEQLNNKSNSNDGSSSTPIPTIIQPSTYNNITNSALSSPSPLPSLPSSPSVISHSSPFTSINDNPLSPVPVHKNQDKKNGFTFLQMDGYEKAYNNTCHY